MISSSPSTATYKKVGSSKKNPLQTRAWKAKRKILEIRVKRGEKKQRDWRSTQMPQTRNQKNKK